jgi:putative FmdB family regulatory protein
MPIYEYRCAACNRKSSLFFRSIATADANPACPHCGKQALERRMSRFWARSYSSRSTDALGSIHEEDGVAFFGGEAEEYGESGEAGSYDDGDDADVSTFAREARHMAQMMGEPLDANLDQALSYIERGADPEDVFGEMDTKAHHDGRESQDNGDE